MHFRQRIGRLFPDAVFEMDGYFVWCGTLTRAEDGTYYFYFSFWEKSLGFGAWVSHSKVGYATGRELFGKFTYRGVALAGRGRGWDASAVHNPAVLCHGGKYYMYYMGNAGNGEFWDHRNRQRIGVAVADRPEGPWQRFDAPLIDVSPAGHDSLLTSNPSVAVGPDGKFYMIYKAVEDNGKLPVGGRVVCGTAVADLPLGPFRKSPSPVLVNPKEDWSVEDAFLWVENGRFYVLAKDFSGYFTKAGKNHAALFESENGRDFRPAADPVGYLREVTTVEGERLSFSFMERPQIYFEEGRPRALLCACMRDENPMTAKHSFHIRLPLDEELPSVKSKG